MSLGPSNLQRGIKYHKYSFKFTYKYTLSDLLFLKPLDSMLKLYHRDNTLLFDVMMRLIMVDLN
jgi:hypothetical protein